MDMKAPVSENNITIEMIESGMLTAARLVQKYGDKYWPILERLETELEIRKSKKERLARLLARAGFE